MKIELSRYLSFWILYVVFIILFLLVPSTYTSPVFGRGPAIIGLSLIFLFYFLPVFFVIIAVLDFMRKRYLTIVKNLIIAVIIFFACYGIRKLIFDKYIYDKREESIQLTPAMPPKGYEPEMIFHYFIQGGIEQFRLN